jgi:hypothetical protein
MKKFQASPVGCDHILAINLEFRTVPVTNLLQQIGQQFYLTLRKTGNGPVSTEMCHSTFHIN